MGVYRMRSRKTRPVPWSTSYFTRLPRGISMTASYAPIVVLLRKDCGCRDKPSSRSGSALKRSRMQAGCELSPRAHRNQGSRGAPVPALAHVSWIAAPVCTRDGRRYRGRVDERRPGLDPAVAEVRLAVRQALAVIEPGGTVVVALSGGADSLALAAAT